MLGEADIHYKILETSKKKIFHLTHFKFCFGFFVQWHINIYGLFNAKAILLGQQWYYLTHS